MPRLLFVSHSSQLYGAERSLLTLIRELKNVHQIAILIPHEGPLVEKLRAEEVEVILAPYKFWIHPGRKLHSAIYHQLFNVFFRNRVEQKARSFRPELIYSNSLAVSAGAKLAKALNVPHVWHIREMIYEDMGYEFDAGLEASLRWIKQSASVICNSETVFKKWHPWLGTIRSMVVYNGLDEEEYGYRPPVTPANGLWRLALVGAIHPGKGHEDAIRALSILVTCGINVSLSFMGGEENGKYAYFLRALIQELGLEKHVRWHGFIEAPFDGSEMQDVLLACSRNEAFGRSCLEAMLSGVPVIAARSGGFVEMIEENRSGLFYNPGDPKGLADAVLRLLKDEKLRNEISVRALARARQFDVRVYAQKIDREITYLCRKSSDTMPPKTAEILEPITTRK